MSVVTAGINWTLWLCPDSGEAIRIRVAPARLGWNGRSITLTSEGPPFPVWPALPMMTEVRNE